jgi:hypothetical protein
MWGALVTRFAPMRLFAVIIVLAACSSVILVLMHEQWHYWLLSVRLAPSPHFSTPTVLRELRVCQRAAFCGWALSVMRGSPHLPRHHWRHGVCTSRQRSRLGQRCAGL